MAPQTRSRRKKALAAAATAPVIDPADRLSQLHPDLQAHILSFLPAQEAVRTCVLARTWRDREVWKLTRRLLFKGHGVLLQDVRGFVDRLLRLRLAGLEDHGPIDACEIKFFWRCDDGKVDEITDAIERWIRLALQCRVQSLRVYTWRQWIGCVPMRDMPLVSRHLTRLELIGLFLSGCLDFSGCPALQHLEIIVCNLESVLEVTSPSVKRLVIIRQCQSDRLKICFPNLVSLWLVNLDDAVVLESMPQLEVAGVSIGEDPGGYNVHHDEEDIIANSECCLVLQGLAEAKHLVLLSDDNTITFRSDLRFCPTYSKLKTLVLNHYWCKSADCSALACMLRHAPVLEKLTVVFSYTVEPKYDMVLEGRPDPSGISTMISQHLKIVELKCSEVINQRVVNVLNFLGTLNIWFKLRVT